MKKYAAILRIRFVNSLQYRVAALAGLATQVAWAALGILALSAFYRADPAAYPMGFEQSTAYIWLQQAFLPMLMLWFFEDEIFTAIQRGNLAYELVRPIGLYSKWFCQSVASRLAKGVLRCAPVLLIGCLTPTPYGLMPPPGLAQFILFLLSLVLGILVVVSFCMLVYIATFYLVSPAGIKTICVFFADFLAGSTIPLPFFPDSIRTVVELLPFASMQNMPLRIYSGDIAGHAAIQSIALQLFWLLVLVAVGRWWMNRAAVRATVQGG